MALLEVNDLHTSFFTDAGEVKAVDGVSFRLDHGKVLGIVGESGSGKSVTAYSVMQILAPTGKIVSGSVKFDGQELVGADEKLLRTAMQDRLHQNYRKKLIPDYEKIEALVRTVGAAFCLSGAGPTLLCITRNPGLEEKLAKKLDSITEHHWQMLPLHVEFEGAHVLKAE